jgi:hypothetical protein
MAVGILPASRARVFHCELDDWDFDARLTDGVCPICGWAPEGGTVPDPAWVLLLRRVQWDFVGLLVLAAVLIVLGVLVAQAAHIIH